MPQKCRRPRLFSTQVLQINRQCNAPAAGGHRHLKQKSDFSFQILSATDETCKAHATAPVAAAHQNTTARVHHRLFSLASHASSLCQSGARFVLNLAPDSMPLPRFCGQMSTLYPF
nr:hypothetical protein [Pandoravirus massiliensis]